MLKKIAPEYLYFPFERVEHFDDGSCVVEGYAFVNESVKGEGGIRIKRSAMEAATEEYLRFANVREMHERKAAGVALSLLWDEKGALMRSKIVDPVACLKIQEGVYKGYSIGVQPTIMRGKDVEALDWLETSLVDRPKDPDAVFTAYRAENLDPDGADCEILEEVAQPPADEERAVDTMAAPIRENLEGSLSEKAVCRVCGERCRICMPDQSQPTTDDETRAAGANEQQPAPSVAEPETFARLAALEAETTTLLTRAELAETELARVQGLLDQESQALTRAKERVATLEAMPAPHNPPVRYPAAFQRDFIANRGNERAETVRQKTELLQELSAQRPSAPDEQNRVAARINVLKQEIAALQ